MEDDGHAEFMQREAERRGPQPEGLKIDIKYDREGPREDPYGVVTYHVTTIDGKVVEFRRGALTGDTLRVNGSEISVEPEPEAEFLAQVGHTVDDIEAWWNEEDDMREEIRAAELAAGWDSNP